MPVISPSGAYPPSFLTILGPTASGKTALAVRVARDLGGEIISADSRQVYRGLDIGAGKDLREYVSGGSLVPHHLIDIIDWDADFSVFDFQERFFAVFHDIRARGRLPLLVGGTGLYLDSILRGYRMAKAPRNEALREELAGFSQVELEARLRQLKPMLHNTTDLATTDAAVRAIEIQEHLLAHPEDAEKERPPIRSLVFGVAVARAALHERIRTRLRERLAGGLIDEARRLRDEGMPWERFAYFGLEYKYLALYLRGEIGIERMEEDLCRDIRRFAKRQETWFRKMERHGVTIHWIRPDDADKVIEAARREGLA